jgi:CRISPR system Cascade subunit CasA
MILWNLLECGIFTSVDISGRDRSQHTLPGVLAALSRGDIGDFPRVRPHQRHVWHAFLVQVAALALGAAGRDAPPEDEDSWRRPLLDLTPEHRDGSAWALVSPPDRPAFLQPPIPGGDLKNFKPIETPDALDLLVNAKNHDLKSGSMVEALPEHWAYALLSLQTQEGYQGKTKYGVSRMNSGYGNRPGVGVAPEGGAAARFLRDLRHIHAARGRLAEDHGYPTRGGLGLVWLEPWDGSSLLSPAKLDVFYIEICRRVRLVSRNGRISALGTGSKARRIEAEALKGATGDPWTPLVNDKDGFKAFTLDAGGFSYKRLVELLFPPASATRAPLQVVEGDDDVEGLSVLARALVRGQSKTKGFHERRIPISKEIRQRMLGPCIATSPLARCAQERVADAGTLSWKVLFPAALMAFTGAPLTSRGERARDDNTAKARTRRAVERFESLVDARFFEDLECEVKVLDDFDEASLVRGRWLLDLRDLGRDVLRKTLAAAPDAAARHWRTQVRALDFYDALFRSPRNGFHARAEAARSERTAAGRPDTQPGAAEEETL